MMNFDYTKYATDAGKSLLDSLLTCGESDYQQYRLIMHDLGRKLGEVVVANLTQTVVRSEVCLACTVEDADFLAKGLLEELESKTKNSVRLACFWNRSTFSPYGFEDFEIAPILKSYEEPVENAECVLVIVKSIVSGACVVATNLTHLVSHLKPS